jgi:hypothetical protein
MYSGFTSPSLTHHRPSRVVRLPMPNCNWSDSTLAVYPSCTRWLSFFLQYIYSRAYASMFFLPLEYHFPHNMYEVASGENGDNTVCRASRWADNQCAKSTSKSSFLAPLDLDIVGTQKLYNLKMDTKLTRSQSERRLIFT